MGEELCPQPPGQLGLFPFLHPYVRELRSRRRMLLGLSVFPSPMVLEWTSGGILSFSFHSLWASALGWGALGLPSRPLCSLHSARLRQEVCCEAFSCFCNSFAGRLCPAVSTHMLPTGEGPAALADMLQVRSRSKHFLPLCEDL